MDDLIILDDTPQLPTLSISAATIADCNLLAAQVQSHLAAAWHKAVILGYKLHLLKAKCKHGEWGKLFGKANSHHGVNFNFGQNMALRYMQLYEACEARAKQLEDADRLSTLLGYTSGEMDGTIDIQAKSEELNSMLQDISGGATSMRQALFAFMHEDDSLNGQSPAAPDFFKRNTRGRVRKGRELSEDEVLERKKNENWNALNRALTELQATLDAGRHLLLPQGCRGLAIIAAQKIISTLMQTHED